MNAVFVDSSVLVAIAFGEAHAQTFATQLDQADVVFAAPLLEAELSSAHRRESRRMRPELCANVRWVSPRRPLSDEIARVHAEGYLRGADTWHLACALYLADDRAQLHFLTADLTQRAVASLLGFRV
jgi:uncharacterized protein with PIN domain